MEHESLRDKLELMDLNQIDGLQWDKERVWSRLNGQLQSTNHKKPSIWYYSIAASLVFLVISLSGYIILKDYDYLRNDSSFPKNQLSLNNTVSKEEICTEQSESPLPQTILDRPIAKVIGNNSITVVKAQEKPKQKLPTTPTPNIAQHTNDMVDKQSIPDIDQSPSEVKELIKSTYIAKDVIAKQNYSVENVLSSAPIERKKNKFKVRLFQRNNKSSRNEEQSIPALTLFASN